MTKEELATERNEVREILEGFSEELSQSNLDKLSRVFCIINGDEKRIAELEETINKLRDQIALRYDLEDKIKELEAQIEKMKCCENCQTVRDAEGNCYLKKDGKCKDKDKWELRR